MSSEFVFNIEERTAGKSHSRSARIDKKVPTVVYGPKFKNQNGFIEEKVVTRYLAPRFESTIFDLKSDSPTFKGVKVLIKNIQRHPVTDRPVHLDLYALDMTRKVRLNVVLEFTGTAIGVKEEGGLFQVVMHEIEIECLPADIPKVITADVTELRLNNSLHISDLKLPNGVRAVTPGERTVATVTAYVEEAAAPVAAAATPAAGAAAPAAGAAPAADAKKPAK